MKLDLTKLKDIATAANTGPWKDTGETWEGDGGAGLCVEAEDGQCVAFVTTWPDRGQPPNALPRDYLNQAHILTFDPPSALELIARVEQLAQRLLDLAEGARSKANLLASRSPTSVYTNPVTVLRALAKEAEDGLVEGCPRASLKERLSEITREAQEAGYAITWWDPASVEGIDVEAMLDVAVQRGNDYISDNAPDPEVLENSGLRKVIEHLVANGWVLSYVDNGEDAVHSKSIEEAVEAAAAVDQAWIHFIKNDGTPARATGYLMLVWGNSPIELIADYGYKEGNGFAEAVEAAQRSVWPNYPDED